MLETNLFYRVTYNGKGIYNELKNNISRETWLSLLSSQSISWLPKPPSYASNNKSYFTEKGFYLFKENVLPIMYQYLDKEKIIIEECVNLKNIIYSDEYQVIINK